MDASLTGESRRWQQARGRGITTGSSVTSLTNKATCGFQNNTFTYHSPAVVRGKANGARMGFVDDKLVRSAEPYSRISPGCGILKTHLPGRMGEVRG